jgi:hypothetical protein
LERYANAHLFQLYPADHSQTSTLTKIALKCGAGLTELDLKYYNDFAKKVTDMTELSHKRNCLLYVDAE